MSDTHREVGNRLHQPQMHVERSHQTDRQAMLAAMRVVLGFPRVIPSSCPDDLLSDAS